MNRINKVLTNVFSSWAVFTINLVISFFLAPFVVNKLGSLYYGIWALMMQLTGYLYLMDFGIRESVIRYVSKYSARQDKNALSRVISAALQFYGGISLLCLLITVILAASFDKVFNIEPEAVASARFVVIITGIHLSQFFCFNTYVGILMGMQRYDVFNKVSMVFSFVRVILIVIFLNRGYGIVALAIIQLGISVTVNLLVFAYAKKLMDYPVSVWVSVRKNMATMKKVVNYSVFVMLGNIGQKIIFYTDAMVIGIFLPASTITYYAIAGSLIEYLRKFVMTMAHVLSPLTSELEASREDKQIITVLIQGTKFSLLFGTPICTVYFFMGQNFISLWMGSEFAYPAWSVLSILSITHLFSLPHFTISSILYGTSKHQIIAYLKLLEAAVNLVLSIILVKRYGIVGVALGTAIPHLISVLFVFPTVIVRQLKISLSYFFLKAYLWPLASSVPFALLCYYLEQTRPADNLLTFFVHIALILPIYIIPAWIMSFSREEKKWQLGALKSLKLKISGGAT